MEEKIQELKQEIKAKLSSVQSSKELNDIRVEYLGKKGPINALVGMMKTLSVEEKKSFGALLNTFKKEVNELIDCKKKKLRRNRTECPIRS